MSGSDFIAQSTMDYLAYLGTSMDKMRQQNKFIDAILICGEKRFSAHRLVLCSHSPFFQQLLLKDVDNNKSIISNIEIEDVDSNIIEMLLEYMYLSNISLVYKIPSALFHKLLTAAELLNISGAVNYLCKSLLQERPQETVDVLWDWAVEFGNEDVEQDVLCYIAEDFSRASQFDYFKNLSRSRLTAILSHPKLAEHEPQDDVMDAILRWIKEDPDSREDYIVNFVSFVSIHKLSEGYIHRLLKREPLIRGVPDFTKDVVYKDPSLIVPRLRHLTDGDQPTPKFEDYKDAKKSSLVRQPGGIRFCDLWRLLPMPQVRGVPVHSHTFLEAVNICEGLALVVSGRDDMNRFVTHLYIPEKKMWSMSYEINIPNREKMAFAFHNGKLFMIGGEDPYQRKQPDVFIFNLMTQMVTEGPPMRVSRCKAGVAQDKQKVYLAGGLNRFGNFMTHVECLDMDEEVWHHVPPMKEKRQSPGLTVVNSVLFAIGGFTNRCESYDPRWDSWQSVIPMPDVFSQTSMVTAEFNDKIFAFRYFKPDRVSCLDPAKNEWRVTRTTGTPPERIVSMHNIEGEFWTLDRTGRLFIFDALNNVWEQGFCCPKNFTKPMHLTIVNIGALKKSSELTD